MPYDPSFPTPNTLADAVQVRGQFAGLKDIIDLLAANTVTSVVIDAVNTVPAGSPASVSASVAGNVLHLTFDIPQGSAGTNGTNGTDGSAGAVGPQGPPFANAIVDAVNTLAPGEPATVSVSFDGTNVHLTFGIPQGADGAPGDVSSAALDAAIAGTSSNTNTVPTLEAAFTNDPPTLADLEVMRAAYNALVLAARR